MSIEPSDKLDKYEYECVLVLANDYSAYDLADHLSDVMRETLSDGRSIWDLSAFDLAMLSVDNYPGGAEGLQFAIMGIEYDA